MLKVNKTQKKIAEELKPEANSRGTVEGRQDSRRWWFSTYSIGAENLKKPEVKAYIMERLHISIFFFIEKLRKNLLVPSQFVIFTLAC